MKADMCECVLMCEDDGVIVRLASGYLNLFPVLFECTCLDC